MSKRLPLFTSVVLLLTVLVAQLFIMTGSLLRPSAASACSWVVTNCGAGCADNKDLYNCGNVQVQAVVADNKNSDSNQKAAAVAPKEVMQAIQPSTAPAATTTTTTTVTPTSDSKKPEGWAAADSKDPIKSCESKGKVFVGGCINGCMPQTKTGQQWVAEVCGVSVAEQQKLASQASVAASKASGSITEGKVTDANRKTVCIEGSATGCTGHEPKYQFMIGNSIMECRGTPGSKCTRSVVKENASADERFDVMGKQVDERDETAKEKAAVAKYNQDMATNCANGRGNLVTCNDGNKLCIDYEANSKTECEKVKKRMDTYKQQDKDPYNWVNELGKTLEPTVIVANKVNTVKEPNTGKDYNCRIDKTKPAKEYNYLCASGVCQEVSGSDRGQCVSNESSIPYQLGASGQCEQCNGKGKTACLSRENCLLCAASFQKIPSSGKIIESIACRQDGTVSVTYDLKATDNANKKWHLTSDGRCSDDCDNSKNACVVEAECKQRLETCLTTRSQQKGHSNTTGEGCNPDGSAYWSYNANSGQIKAKLISPGDKCVEQAGFDKCMCEKQEVEFGKNCPDTVTLIKKLDANGNCVACNAKTETCVSTETCAQLKKDCEKAKSLFPSGEVAKCTADGKATGTSMTMGTVVVELDPKKSETCPKQKTDDKGVTYNVSSCSCNGQSIQVSTKCLVAPTTKQTIPNGCQAMLTDLAHYACWTVACDNRELNDKKWTRCAIGDNLSGQCTYCTAVGTTNNSKIGAINCANLITKSQQSPATAECKDELCQNQENNGGGWKYCQEETGKTGFCKYCREKTSTATTGNGKQVSCTGMIGNANFECITNSCDNRENTSSTWAYCLEGSGNGRCQYCQPRLSVTIGSTPLKSCIDGNYRCGAEVGSNLWYKYQVCQNGTWSSLMGKADDTKCPATLVYQEKSGSKNVCKEGDRSACGKEGGCDNGQQRLCQQSGQLGNCVWSDACASQRQAVSAGTSCADLKQLNKYTYQQGYFVGCSGKQNCYCSSNTGKVVCTADSNNDSCGAAGNDSPISISSNTGIVGKVINTVKNATDSITSTWNSLVANSKKQATDRAASDIKSARAVVNQVASDQQVTLSAVGAACSTGGDCLSGFCMKKNGPSTCVNFIDLKNDAEKCGDNSQCRSGLCQDGVCQTGNYADPQIVPGTQCVTKNGKGNCVCRYADGSSKTIPNNTYCNEIPWAGCSVDAQCWQDYVCRDVFDDGQHMRKCMPKDDRFAACAANQTFCPECLASNPRLTAAEACVSQGISCNTCKNVTKTNAPPVSLKKTGCANVDYPYSSLDTCSIDLSMLSTDDQLKKTCSHDSVTGCFGIIKSK